jgi:hypothetical protein
MKSLLSLLMLLIAFAVATVAPTQSAAAATYRIADTQDVDTVPSWFPVGFCLLTHGDSQFAAYYNDKHQMIVARRKLDGRQWQKVELPAKIGWDSHNYITMAIDASGHIHLAGNMHCVPLIYFRTREPGDIATFERLPMTGEEEQRCTYPRFLHDADGNLLFTYRSGGSGNGRRLYNGYNIDSKAWSRFLDSPLFDGEGQRNAYPRGPIRGPIRGPAGFFHVVWVWRDTPDCATNHHLSYARSSDLKNWETAGGKPVRLPLTLGQTELCVDPIPPGGGIINGCQHLAFDSRHRPILAYHKSDENGHMQIYVARFEQGRWQRRAITNWDKSILFSGGGAMPFIGIAVSDVKIVEPGTFLVTYRHRDFGGGRIVLDEETLTPVNRDLSVPSAFPRELSRPTMDFPGIGVRLAQDLGGAAETDSQPSTKYVLRWQTLVANHDRPRKPPLPPPSVLQLIKLERLRAE